MRILKLLGDTGRSQGRARAGRWNAYAVSLAIGTTWNETGRIGRATESRSRGWGRGRIVRIAPRGGRGYVN